MTNSKKKEHLKERPNEGGFSWSSFDMDKFFVETNKIGKILKECKTETEDDWQENNFKNKFSLLDTNILKEMVKNTKRSDAFRPVFEFLKKFDTKPVIIEATKFEFVGYSTNKSAYEELSKWVATFDSIPILKEDFELATKLSVMYKCKNSSISPKQISLVDCLHAAALVKYNANAFIVTTDVNDYPSFLFDMPKHMPIDEGGGITTFVAFKTFNRGKYDSLCKMFDGTK